MGDVLRCAGKEGEKSALVTRRFEASEKELLRPCRLPMNSLLAMVGGTHVALVAGKNDPGSYIKARWRDWLGDVCVSSNNELVAWLAFAQMNGQTVYEWKRFLVRSIDFVERLLKGKGCKILMNQFISLVSNLQKRCYRDSKFFG